MPDPDYVPSICYAHAESNFDVFMESNPDAEEILVVLSDRLVHAINGMELNDDPDLAEEEMRRLVLQLQATSFLAGMYYQETVTADAGGVTSVADVPTDYDREELEIEITAEQKLELTRNLLNGHGISLKIL